MTGPEERLQGDFDRRLQRQLLSMNEDEAKSYAHLMSGIIERILAEPTTEPAAARDDTGPDVVADRRPA